ncbi:hypothetical protein SAMN04487944_11571 [Gracilibacillus ureilyticus]|uniref:Uncharacterized protein n=1 Tax=Gracilibacillus ureilyticus TaxID=531814 RepID=A0A1H9TZU8_9BACI|nr:hypothetical protein [Gracilibacillus ureilyticus]SES02323.1 hypothetical protein SAMN04487944_11571 [Gracilibacillus ureilyticus]
MRNFKLFLILLLGITFFLSACSNESQNHVKTDDEKEMDETEENKTNDEEESHTEDKQNAPSVHIEMEGQVTYEDHTLTVEGKTNLLPDSNVFVYPQAFGGVSFIGVSGSAIVEQDGTFVYETKVPEEYNYGLFVNIRFRPEDSINDSAKEFYGEYGENLEGPMISLYESDEKVRKQALTEVYLPVKNGEAITKEIETPEWQVPDDYGDPNVRMDANVTYDDQLIYIKGESNLLEGSELMLTLLSPEGSLTGVNGWASVKPDGSFFTVLDRDSYEEELDSHKFRLIFAPSKYSWETIRNNYGDSGEKITGEHVKEKLNDQEAELLIDIGGEKANTEE